MSNLNPSLIGHMPPEYRPYCGHGGPNGCDRLARWHVMVPEEVMPEGWTGLIDPGSSRLLCVCDLPEHIEYIERAFPVRLAHPHDQDVCLRPDATYLEHACVTELPAWAITEAAETATA